MVKEWCLPTCARHNWVKNVELKGSSNFPSCNPCATVACRALHYCTQCPSWDNPSVWRNKIVLCPPARFKSDQVIIVVTEQFNHLWCSLYSKAPLPFRIGDMFYASVIHRQMNKGRNRFLHLLHCLVKYCPSRPKLAWDEPEQDNKRLLAVSKKIHWKDRACHFLTLLLPQSQPFTFKLLVCNNLLLSCYTI